jgi:hypothetical protein
LSKKIFRATRPVSAAVARPKPANGSAVPSAARPAQEIAAVDRDHGQAELPLASASMPACAWALLSKD